MLEEARLAAFAARNRPDRKRFISARETLEAATLGGARAMGLDQKTGSLEAGKHADIAVISVASISQQPMHDIEAALVFLKCDVTMTMVAGSKFTAGRRPEPRNRDPERTQEHQPKSASYSSRRTEILQHGSDLYPRWCHFSFGCAVCRLAGTLIGSPPRFPLP
jgi:5-methylthioadenosine/S-adenosylhomocysteine deaminase